MNRSIQDDIRWHQRFNNYRRALARLTENIDYIKELYDHMDLEDNETYRDIALGIRDIYKQGLIQSFEFTHELAWKVMQDFAKHQGSSEIRGSRDAIRYAAQVNLLDNAHEWMNMIMMRNESSHTYNDDTANDIFYSIITKYHPLFLSFETKMLEIRNGESECLS